MSRALPPTASVATPQEGDKLHAPAAERNAATISAFLRAHVPVRGTALELASGTGQHVCRFAADLPGLFWHPTDVDDARLRSIDAHVAEAGLRNVANATYLDATQTGWGAERGPVELIVLVNLLHLISTPEARTLLAEAAEALAPGGILMLYGPFTRGGVLTSEGDRRFDAQLRAADAMIGYKDDRDLYEWLGACGLAAEPAHEMPANNLIFLARKPER